jgi:hypothetical protein
MQEAAVEPPVPSEVPDVSEVDPTTSTKTSGTAEEKPKESKVPAAMAPEEEEHTEKFKPTETGGTDDSKAPAFHADEKLEDFEWEELLGRFEKEMDQKNEDERKLLEDFQRLVNVINAVDSFLLFL